MGGDQIGNSKERTDRPQIIIYEDTHIRVNRKCCSEIFNILMCYCFYSRINTLDSYFDSDDD
jgi:hypothetical protein